MRTTSILTPATVVADSAAANREEATRLLVDVLSHSRAVDATTALKDIAGRYGWAPRSCPRDLVSRQCAMPIPASASSLLSPWACPANGCHGTGTKDPNAGGPGFGSSRPHGGTDPGYLHDGGLVPGLRGGIPARGVPVGVPRHVPTYSRLANPDRVRGAVEVVDEQGQPIPVAERIRRIAASAGLAL